MWLKFVGKEGKVMRYLKQFLRFSWADFAAGKSFTVTNCSPWVEFGTKEHLGTKIETTISEDHTSYHTKDGGTTTNLFEKQTIKVTKDINIPVGTIVVPVNPTVYAYGMDNNGKFSNDFLNRLSVKCDDIQILQNGQKA